MSSSEPPKRPPPPLALALICLRLFPCPSASPFLAWRQQPLVLVVRPTYPTSQSTSEHLTWTSSDRTSSPAFPSELTLADELVAFFPQTRPCLQHPTHHLRHHFKRTSSRLIFLLLSRPFVLVELACSPSAPPAIPPARLDPRVERVPVGVEAVLLAGRVPEGRGRDCFSGSVSSSAGEARCVQSRVLGELIRLPSVVPDRPVGFVLRISHGASLIDHILPRS